MQIDLYRKLKEKGDGMPISIAICNDKGGSGKTTTAINIAEALSRIELRDENTVKKIKSYINRRR